jgi:Na+/H+ antiporter NhaC
MKFNKGVGFYFQPIKMFGLFLFKPLSLVLGALVFLLSKFLVMYLGIDNISLYIVIVFAVFFYSFFIANYYVCNRRRFFFLEQNGTILFLLLQFGQFFNRSANQSAEASMYINTSLLFLLLSFVLFYYNEMVIFKAKNKYLFL